MNMTTGECHLSIVENVVRQLRDASYLGDIVLRSTVPVGTSDRLQCHFFPEFLTEKNWERDVRECPQWIIGSHDQSFIQKFSHLIDWSFLQGNIKSIQIVTITPPVAETVKLFRNTFLATKIAFCNEWYRFCQKNNLDYETMRKTATADPRIGPSHSHVPGHDNHTGFGGTCFPKDIASAIHQFHLSETACPVLTAVNTRNNDIDRPDHDWATDLGRAVIHTELDE
jgi:UDPglucose 6-dehydrogenase